MTDDEQIGEPEVDPIVILEGIYKDGFRAGVNHGVKWYKTNANVGLFALGLAFGFLLGWGSVVVPGLL